MSVLDNLKQNTKDLVDGTKNAIDKTNTIVDNLKNTKAGKVATKVGEQTSDLAKKGEKIAKTGGKHLQKEAETRLLDNDQKQGLDTLKKTKNAGKNAVKGVKRIGSFIKWGVSSGPVGWVTLGVVTVAGMGLITAIGNEMKEVSDNINQQTSKLTQEQKYTVILQDCPPNVDRAFNKGEIEEGSGPGDWQTPGTDANMRAKYLFEALTSLGLSNTTAAAAIGNAAIESGHTFHPAIVETAYKDKYNPVKLFDDIGAWLSPSPKANTSSPSEHGTAGRGLFQESPGILLSHQDGTNGFKWQDVFGMGDDWEQNVRDRNKIAAGIWNELEYFFLVKNGAGMSATGYSGLKDGALNDARVGSHSLKDDVLLTKDIERATRGWYWFFEIGDYSVWDAAGGPNRIKMAKRAYEMFAVDGRDDYDESLLKNIGGEGNELIGKPTGKDANCKPKESIDRSDIVKLAVSLVGYWSYSQENRHSIIPTLDNPQRGVGQTDCSGFVWAVYKMAGYKVPPEMGATMSMYADAYGPQEYYELVPESEAKAGDAIVHDPGGAGSAIAHTAIIMEDWKGYYNTPIVQEGGTERNVNAGQMASTSIAEPYFFVRPKAKAK